jgi:hypothetical protein
MAFVEVHRIITTPEWWEVAGYHPRIAKIEQARRRETISGTLKDDGTKPEGATRKNPIPFSVTYIAGSNLADVARFVEWNVRMGNDITRLIFN